MRSARLQYALLLLLMAGSLTNYFACVTSGLHQVFDRNFPRPPLEHGYALEAISGTLPEARKAGLHVGGHVLAVNGVPFTGYNVLLRQIRHLHAGDQLQVVYIPHDLPTSGPRTTNITLAAYYPQRPTVLHIVTQEVFLSILLPLGCLLLGFWVVAARPHDLNAWLMLGMMQYFTTIFAGDQTWPGFLLGFCTSWQVASQFTGTLSIMLFGIYFPERFKFDCKHPWFKWAVVGLLTSLVPVALAYQLGFNFSFNSVRLLAGQMHVVFRLIIIGSMIAIGTYFAGIGTKAGTASSPDTRRRLKLLDIGSTVGNLPFFIIVLISLFRGTDIGAGIPAWILIISLATFALFPITLAYVVVVYRAMELRIILRQGTKYALARTGIWFVRALITLLLALAVMHATQRGVWRVRDIVHVSVLGAVLLVFRFQLTKRLSAWIDRKFFREAYSTEQVLAELASQVQGFTEVQPLVRTVAERIGQSLHVERIAVLLRSGNVFHLQYACGLDTVPDLSLAENSTTITELDRSRGATNVFLDRPEDWLVEASPAEREALRKIGAEMLLPLPGRTRLAGVMALGPKLSEEPYSRTDRTMLQAVALHTGLSIENSELMRSLAQEARQRERINREMEIAREVQERFLPQSVPHLKGLDLAGAYRPAQSVGGDYYDFMELDGPDSGSTAAKLGVAIGDISGKGISAALLMASLRAGLRGMIRNANGSMTALMQDLNALIFDASETNRYATFFFAELNTATGELTYINAGHNAPAIVRASENGAPAQLVRLETGGPVIGLLPRADYCQATLKLGSGDAFLAFTDGISEAMRADGEEWGEDRLIAEFARCRSLPSDEIVKCLMRAADTFAAGAPQHDDMTVVVMKLQA